MSAFQKITSEFFFNYFLCRRPTYYDKIFLSEVLKFLSEIFMDKMPCRQRSEKKKTRHKKHNSIL